MTKHDQTKSHHSFEIQFRWALCIYDFLMLLLACFFTLVLHPSVDVPFTWKTILLEVALSTICLFIWRFVLRVYRQIWRYGGSEAYIRLMLADFLASVFYVILEYILPIRHITAMLQLSIMSVQLLLCIMLRLIYQFLYQQVRNGSTRSHIWASVLKRFGGIEFEDRVLLEKRINIAILGAGQVGAKLAEELLMNPQSAYLPVLFLDNDKKKTGRDLMGIPVIEETEGCQAVLKKANVQQIVIAVPKMSLEEKHLKYEFYHAQGFMVKLYEHPTTEDIASETKRQLRDFDIEELLFRPAQSFDYERIAPQYKDKTILVTGGGGSIGSEMARQVAIMNPKKIVLADIFENGAYDVAQELIQKYKGKPEVCIEILSICDEKELEKAFIKHRPEIVIHAAAHKHVPLMENNCCEAVKNNVFGTKNVVEMSIKYNVARFLMVSTDKAVNPTNVMGATKRICEMIVLNAAARQTKTIFCATRFGNVLGSSGSVIPLFRRQIINGGPVTITDKRIIRYFMTIPEASRLVLTAGALAKNGELFVLDMGNPVKILDLAETMINLSGYVPYKDIDIVETGLRPGEKLYEELLVKGENTGKTENEQIFTEKDEPLSDERLKEIMEKLKSAVDNGDNEIIRQTLHDVLPTYRTSEEVNAKVVFKN